MPTEPNESRPAIPFAGAPVDLLDWFAGQALAGYLAWSPADANQCTPEDAAQFSYRYAAAMLAERRRIIDAARAKCDTPE